MVKVCEEQFPPKEQVNKTAGFYMDGYLKSNLDVLKKAIMEDWDGLVVVDGPEGSGKSVLAQQLAYYVDPTLDLNRIVFRPDSFKSAVLKAKKYQAVIFDEAFGGLSSRKAMSEVNHSLVSMLTEIRQKNLFLFIVLPSFFDLDKYAALFRSRCLIHVYADKFQRGYFRFYNYARKKDLYVNGKKFYNYKCVQPDFSGRFTNFYPCGKDEYKKKKLNSLRAYDPGKPKLNKQEIERALIKDKVRGMFAQKEIPVNQTQIAQLLNIDRHAVGRYLKTKD